MKKMGKMSAITKVIVIVIVFSLLQTYLLFLDQFATVVMATTQSSVLDSLYIPGDQVNNETVISEENTDQNFEEKGENNTPEIVQETVSAEESETDINSDNNVNDEELAAEFLDSTLEITKSYRFDSGIVLQVKISDELANIRSNLESGSVKISVPSLDGYTLRNTYIDEVTIDNEDFDYSYSVNENNETVIYFIDKVEDISETDNSTLITEEDTINEEVIESDNIENEINEDTSEEIDLINISGKYLITYIFDGDAELGNISLNKDLSLNYPEIDSVSLNTEFASSIYIEEKIENSYNISAENTSMYKGYMYANTVSSEGYETSYTSINNIEINSIENIDNIVISNLVDNIISKDGTQVSLDGYGFYKQTSINVDEFDSIFGEEGYIEVFSSGRAIGRIDSSTEIVDGNYVFTYKENLSNVEFSLNVITGTGNLKILNDKVIGESALFDRSQIINFSKIDSNSIIQEYSKVSETEVKLFEESKNLEINLEDTESKMDMTLSTTDFLTEFENNVTFNITLETNQEKYELFENPVIEVILPLSVEEISINSINLLYKNGLSINNWTVEQSETGEQIIKVILSGTQEEYYPESLIEGTTVVINSTIKVDEFTANGKSNVKLRYSNEAGMGISYAKNGKEAQEYEINYVSKSGLVKATTFENFNNANDVIFNLNDEKEIGTLDISSEEKVSKMSMKVLNNYDTVLKDVYIIGRIPSIGNTDKNGDDLNSTFDSSLKSQITVNGLPCTIYYSNKVDAEKDDGSWTEEVTDLSEIRSYKIVINSGEMKKGDIISFEYDLSIPENLSYNEKAYGVYYVIYKLNEETITEESVVGMETTEKELGVEDCQTSEAVEEAGLEIGTQATIAGKVINEGDEVNERQILQYTAVLKNTSSIPITNIKLQGNAENANSYYFYTYQMEDSTDGEMITAGEYKEDTDGTHLYDEEVVDVLNPGETYTFTYLVKVKRLSDIDTNELYGKIVVSADGVETQEITTIKNTIREAYIELSIKKSGEEDINDTSVGSGGAYYLSTTVKNLTNETLENVPVTIFLSKELEANEYTRRELEGVNLVGIEESTDGTKVTVNVPEIESGETIIFQITAYTKSLDKDTEKVTSTVYATSEINDVIHISNEYQKDIYQVETVFELTFTSSIPNYSKVNDGDKVTYTIEIENTGIVESYTSLLDEIPYGFIVDNIYSILSTGETETIEYDDNYNEVVETYYLEPKEKVTIKIEGTISADDLRTGQTTIVNNCSLPLEEIESEDIIFYIDNVRDLQYEETTEETLNNYENEEEEYYEDDGIVESVEDEEYYKDDDDNILANNDLEDREKAVSNSQESITVEKTSNENNNTQTVVKTNTVSTIKYSISGKVWLDKDEDGLYKTEDLIKDVKVYLYKTDSNNIKSIESIDALDIQETESNGEYEFSGVESGKYVLIFEYDNTKYEVTKYQANGTRDSKSSDVISKEIKLNNTTKKYAISDVIEVSDTSIVNLNMGLIENKDFDLGIKTYISKVTVENDKETYETTFDENDSLAKVEIASKYLDESIVTANYVIKITNNGIQDGYINQLSFSIPEGFTLKGNTSWKLQSDGKIYDSSLSKEVIKSGETKTLNVALEKVMTSINTGTFKSEAKIEESTNDLQLVDYDTSNDISDIELIITVKTGAVYYVAILIIIIVMATIAIFIINRLLKNNQKIKIIDRIIICVSIVVLVILALIINNYAAFTSNVTDTVGDAYYEVNKDLVLIPLKDYFAKEKSDLIGKTWTLKKYKGAKWRCTDQCVEPENKSGGTITDSEGKYISGNVIQSVATIEGTTYTRWLKGDTDTNQDNKYAAALGYLSEKLEEIRKTVAPANQGNYHHVFTNIILHKTEFKENISKIMGFSMSVDASYNNNNNNRNGWPTAKKMINESIDYMNSLDSTTMEKYGKGKITNLDYVSDTTADTTDLTDTTDEIEETDGKYGPLCVNISAKAQKFKLTYRIDGSNTEHEIKTIILNDKEVKVSDLTKKKINKTVFYISESDIPNTNKTIYITFYAKGMNGYKARIMLCTGGGQNRAIMRGKETTITTSVIYKITSGQVSVNKYVSDSTSRASYNHDKKESSPVTVTLNDDNCSEETAVTKKFKIVVKSSCKYAVKVKVTDKLETGGSYFIIEAYDLENNGWTEKDGKYVQTVTVPANGKVVLYLKVKIYLKKNYSDYEKTLSSTKTYQNKVSITSSDSKANLVSGACGHNTAVACDFIKVKWKHTVYTPETPSGNIEKYISAVYHAETGKTTTYTDRSNQSSNSKYINPVIVHNGDKVTYTIIATYTGSETGMVGNTIYNCQLRDTPENGLQLDTKTTSGLSNFSMTSGVSYSTTVDVIVTASNLYLYNLENDIDFVSANYTELYYDSHPIAVGTDPKTGATIYSSYTDSHTRTSSVSQSSINTINSGNKDKDYVRLDELQIAGNVFVDKNKDGYNNDGSNLSGITVILHDITDGGDFVTTTDSNGYYEFNNFYKGTEFKKSTGTTGYYPNTKYSQYGDNVTAEYKQYYLEYQYDGIKYISTNYSYRNNLISGTNKCTNNYYTDSNACEFALDRATFDGNLETIGYNKGINTNGTITELSFTKSGHISTWDTTEDLTISSYSFVNNVASGSLANGNIDTLFLSTDGEIEYLKHINLGLQEREKLDLRITKDLMEAQVRINDYTMNYDYGQLNQNSLYEKTDTYQLYIYKTDYLYRYEMYKNQAVRDSKGKESELQVDLTYKITVYNASPDATYAKINEIIDSYTNTMSIKKDTDVYMVKNGVQTNLEVLEASEKSTENLSEYNSECDYSADGYRTCFITGMDSVVLSKGEYFEVYITYTVDKNDSRSIYLGEKDNIVQIGAYSTYENATGTTAKGLIDIDSNVGNINSVGVNISNTSLYEDTAFKVKANIQLKSSERKVTGFVFEDSRSEKVSPFSQFIGNGIYNNSDERNSELISIYQDNGMTRDNNQDSDKDKKLDGMTVELIEIVTVGDTIYEETIDPISYAGETISYITTKENTDKDDEDDEVDDSDFDSYGTNFDDENDEDYIQEDYEDDTEYTDYDEDFYDGEDGDYSFDFSRDDKDNVIVRTTTDGKYEISSFIPGTYIVRFRYGDIYTDDTITTNSLIHNGQDYKSTTYTLTDGTTDESGNVLESSADNDLKYAKLTQANKSDARDNEYRRIEVMAESEVMTHDVAEFMKYTQYNVNNLDQSLKFVTEDKTLREFSEATNCFADTITVSLGIENKSDTKNTEGTEVEYRNFNDISLWMPNIDYGVVFRPENFIELTKKIKTITINTSDGNTLLSLKYTEDGTLDSNENQVGLDLVQSIDTIGTIQGFRYINIDEDIMQGATISIEYYLLADNVGEVDTVNTRLLEEGGSTAVKEKLKNSESVLYSNDADTTYTYKNYSRMDKLIKAAYGSSDSYYYGRYLGGVYYNGSSYSNLKSNTGSSISTETVVVPVTVNRIIDWVDNDATFVSTNNIDNNKYWSTVVEAELIESNLIGPQGLYVQNGVYYYKDEYERKYTTDTRNNIVLSSDNATINSDLVKAIYPELYTAESLETRGRITIEINANLSAGEDEKKMTYDNVSEVVKFTTATGRRTNFASTIGNIKLTDTTSNKTPFSVSTEEVDQAGTEVVSLVPPTGLTMLRLMIAYYSKAMTIAICIIAAMIIFFIIEKTRKVSVFSRKKIYKYSYIDAMRETKVQKKKFYKSIYKNKK